jgi:polar amino acid transport system substrate-binding protein
MQIKSQPLKCITTTTWAPFNTLKNGKLYGLAVDYWRLIEAKLSTKCVCKTVANWSDVLEEIETKKSDLTFSTDKTPQKEKFAVFSKPYAKFPIVFATKNDIGFIADIKIIKNKKIAVGKNYTVDQLFKIHYPNMDIVRTKNIEGALELLREGKVFAVADILPVITYHINQYKFSNLKISGRTPWTFSARIMLRDDYKKLLPAINRAIDSISEDEKLKINSKWVDVRYKEPYSTLFLGTTLLVVVLLLLIVLGWIYILKKEITKRIRLENRLELLATTDRLTNIYNRYKMDIELEKQLELSKRYKRPFSLIYFDIDFFKKVNDSFGHKTGDIALTELSTLIQNSIRKSDILGRWGGEEFLIILPETNKQEALELAAKLREIVENHNFKKIKKLTCSFGIATFKESDDAQSIIIRIDRRLYKAKENGRNRVEFS